MGDEGQSGVGRTVVGRSRPADAAATLAAHGVSITFGGVKALRNVTLEIDRGEIVGLIGPNGAGKTTFLNVLSGFFRSDEGQVVLNGEDVTQSKPDRPRVRVCVGRSKTSTSLAISRSSRTPRRALWEWETVDAMRERAAYCLYQLGLGEVGHLKIGSLNHAQQRRLASLERSPRNRIFSSSMSPQRGLVKRRATSCSKHWDASEPIAGALC